MTPSAGIIAAAYAVMRCLCVCLSVTFVNCVKTSNRIFQIVSPTGSQISRAEKNLDFLKPISTALQISHAKHHNIPTGTAITGASNTDGVG